MSEQVQYDSGEWSREVVPDRPVSDVLRDEIAQAISEHLRGRYPSNMQQHLVYVDPESGSAHPAGGAVLLADAVLPIIERVRADAHMEGFNEALEVVQNARAWGRETP